MPKITIIAKGVSFAGADLAVGEAIEVSEKSAAALIAEGKAEAVEGSTAADAQNGPQDGANGSPDANGPEGGQTDAAKQAEALDAQYKRDELYDAAKQAGVDIAFDAKKAEIIAAVIDQGFAAALIK